MADLSYNYTYELFGEHENSIEFSSTSLCFSCYDYDDGDNNLGLTCDYSSYFNTTWMGDLIYCSREIQDSDVVWNDESTYTLVSSTPGVFSCTSTPDPWDSDVIYNASCIHSNLGNEDSNNSQIITSEQVSSMGSAVVQAGSGLLHIGIQILPYSIAFTIILLIFGLVKNWSKLKANRQLKRIKNRKRKNDLK